MADHVRERPFDPSNDGYGVEEFSRSIKTTRNSPIFSMHAYHLGKKPHDAVEAYIRHYTSEGDLVLDPFCGSGSTALSALINGRKAVAIDVSPAATFITRFYVSPCDPEDLAGRFERMCRKVSPEMEYLYGTVCHRCGGPATIHYLIYSNVYHCPSCASRVSLFEAACHQPPCCPDCLSRHGLVTAIRPGLAIESCEPVAVNFSCRGSCIPKRITRSLVGPPDERSAFLEIDLPRVREIESEPVPYPHPHHYMMNCSDRRLPWGDEWRPSRDFRRVQDLFTGRNLRALAALLDAAGRDQDLRAVITSVMFAVSRKAQHLDTGGGYIPGNWALPPMSKQRNVMESLRRVFRRTRGAKERLASMIRGQEVRISTQSAVSMAEIPSDSVDYIFTDPPYAGSVQYGELNFVWEAWLGLRTDWHNQEIIVNNSRGRTIEDWTSMMQEALSECYRVLKPGRWLSLCWHHSSQETWGRVQQVMARSGLKPGDSDRAVTIDTGSETYNQRLWDKLVKRDLVISYRKPFSRKTSLKAGEQPPSRADFRDRARAVISAFLADRPGAAKDAIYDHLMSVMIRSGPLEPHSFDEMLGEVARESGPDKKQWFLR